MHSHCTNPQGQRGHTRGGPTLDNMSLYSKCIIPSFHSKSSTSFLPITSFATPYFISFVISRWMKHNPSITPSVRRTTPKPLRIDAEGRERPFKAAEEAFNGDTCRSDNEAWSVSDSWQFRHKLQEIARDSPCQSLSLSVAFLSNSGSLQVGSQFHDTGLGGGHAIPRPSDCGGGAVHLSASLDWEWRKIWWRLLPP